MNDVAVSILLICAITVCLCCFLLVFHPEYDDGLLGRLGMAMITFVGVARVLRYFDEIPDHVPPNLLIMWVGLALFFGRHTYRFLRRATWKGPDWYKRNYSNKGTNLFRKRTPPLI
jgi:hypothetical protein